MFRFSAKVFRAFFASFVNNVTARKCLKIETTTAALLAFGHAIAHVEMPAPHNACCHFKQNSRRPFNALQRQNSRINNPSKNLQDRTQTLAPNFGGHVPCPLSLGIFLQMTGEPHTLSFIASQLLTSFQKKPSWRYLVTKVYQISIPLCALLKSGFWYNKNI